MILTARELCTLVDGELEGDPEVIVTQPSKIEEAKAGSLSFLANPKYESFIYHTDAAVVLVEKSFTPSAPVNATLIRVSDVYQSLGLLLNSIAVEDQLDGGVSEMAYVHQTVELGNDVTIGPFSYVGQKSTVGDNSKIFPQVYIGDEVRIGKNVTLFPGVKIYRHCVIADDCVIHANSVIGSDGFGFARAENGEFNKIAQVGNVVLEQGVEIGANTVIDRATMGSTILSKGVKLDNLVHIAHNVKIGANSAIAAQAGIAGSTKIGKEVLIGGQAGFVGHIQVADRVRVQAQSGVAASVEEVGAKIYGSPALKYRDYLKSYSLFRRLPDIEKRIAAVEEQLSKTAL